MKGSAAKGTSGVAGGSGAGGRGGGGVRTKRNAPARRRAHARYASAAAAADGGRRLQCRGSVQRTRAGLAALAMQAKHTARRFRPEPEKGAGTRGGGQRALLRVHGRPPGLKG